MNTLPTTNSALSTVENVTDKDFSKSLLTDAQLHGLELQQRPPVLGEWLREGDAGMIFSQRGAGKTWFAICMARALAQGLTLGSYRCPQPRRVIYMDAEMGLRDIKDRSEKLGLPVEGLNWLSYEKLIDSYGKGLDFADHEQQEAILACVFSGDVIFFDNLSTGARGMRENEADDWAQMTDFILRLRAKNVTTIFIHHAGKSGNQRGTSGREDILQWVIKLTSDNKGNETAFVTTFDNEDGGKCRNCPAYKVPPMRWTLRESGDRLELNAAPFGKDVQVLSAIREGLESATAIADELGMSKSNVSKIAKKLAQQGNISITKRKYKPVCSYKIVSG